MLRELSAHAPALVPTIFTTLCFAIFVLVAIYVITDRRRSHHSAMEHLPLDDGNDHHA